MFATRHYIVLVCLIAPILCDQLRAAEFGDAARDPEPKGRAARGYRLLLEKPFVPPYFDQETVDNVWRAWPASLRSIAAKASPEERRQMTFERYGLTGRPRSNIAPIDDPKKPLQFVVDDDGHWTPNCFTCHGGRLLADPYPGVPNTEYALQTMIQETRLTKLRLRKSMMTIDLGAFVMPLGSTVGTTNAVIFGVALAADRDADLNLRPSTEPPHYVHHDMDAPPWWHFRKKSRLYLDGFAAKGHRPLMQFALDPSNGPEKFIQWEEDFRDIFAYMESLEAPKYPFAINRNLAADGRVAFERVCAECHGTYGAQETYPHRIVPIDEIGTDRARFIALTDKHRAAYAQNWFSHYGKKEVITAPGGYMAPPLDGIWASAPYFHNGSVPTLWHVLEVANRPAVWRRNPASYDRARVGFEITEFTEMPTVHGVSEKRRYFDTGRFGKSAAGHRFPEALSDLEKKAVLEYLKTL
jgi:mono/diheme cytochrome c family protein